MIVLLGRYTGGKTAAIESFRTSNDISFYCQIPQSNFCHSPHVTETYFTCLNVLRSREVKIDDFHVEDTHDQLSKAFKLLIVRLASSNPEFPDPIKASPTLLQYLSPGYFVCGLAATNKNPEPYVLDANDHGWGSRSICVDDAFLADLDRWTQSYHPANIEICYGQPDHVLIRPPKVAVDGKDSHTDCFSKLFNISFGHDHYREELMQPKRIALANIRPPPDALVYRLHGVFRHGDDWKKCCSLGLMSVTRKWPCYTRATVTGLGQKTLTDFLYSKRSLVNEALRKTKNL